MKKISCVLDGNDFVRVSSVFSDTDSGTFLESNEGEKMVQIYLSPRKIRKLRKQLKKALIAIEGEGKEEGWKSGDKVFLVHGCNEGDDYCTSPSVIGIDISKPVTLIEERNSRGEWELEYKDVNNKACIGYAYEKDFKRA